MGECAITVCICYCGHLFLYGKLLPFLIEHGVVSFLDSLVSSMTVWLGIAAISYVTEYGSSVLLCLGNMVKRNLLVIKNARTLV